MTDAIERLSAAEQQWLVRNERLALRLARGYLGDDLAFDCTEADLDRLQSMIDGQAFDSETPDDLHSFGVVLGNVFNAQTSMKWALVTNEFGRHIALHDPTIGFTLYPIQMIAKRIQGAREVNVLELYRGFVRDLGLHLAAWLTVYCARSVREVTASDILKDINEADFYTIAEGFGIDDEDAVDQALTELRIEPTSELDGVKFQLQYRSPQGRPVLIHVWTSVDRVQSVRLEAMERLTGSGTEGLARVRSHLDQVIEIVALELQWNQLDDMGVILAGQVAEYFADLGAGLIRDQNHDWWAVENRVPVLLVGPQSRG